MTARSARPSGAADVDDFDPPVARAVLRLRLRAIARLRRSDAGPAQSGAVVDALLQDGDDAHRALARQLEIILELERLDRLVVRVPDDQDTARHLVQRRRDTLQGLLVRRVDGRPA